MQWHEFEWKMQTVEIDYGEKGHCADFSPLFTHLYLDSDA